MTTLVNEHRFNKTIFFEQSNRSIKIIKNIAEIVARVAFTPFIALASLAPGQLGNKSLKIILKNSLAITTCFHNIQLSLNPQKTEENTLKEFEIAKIDAVTAALFKGCKIIDAIKIPDETSDLAQALIEKKQRHLKEDFRSSIRSLTKSIEKKPPQLWLPDFYQGTEQLLSALPSSLSLSEEEAHDAYLLEAQNYAESTIIKTLKTTSFDHSLENADTKTYKSILEEQLLELPIEFSHFIDAVDSADNPKEAYNELVIQLPSDLKRYLKEAHETALKAAEKKYLLNQQTLIIPSKSHPEEAAKENAFDLHKVADKTAQIPDLKSPPLEEAGSDLTFSEEHILTPPLQEKPPVITPKKYELVFEQLQQIIFTQIDQLRSEEVSERIFFKKQQIATKLMERFHKEITAIVMQHEQEVDSPENTRRLNEKLDWFYLHNLRYATTLSESFDPISQALFYLTDNLAYYKLTPSN